MNRLFFTLSKSGKLQINLLVPDNRPRWLRWLIHYLMLPYRRYRLRKTKREIQRAAQDTLNSALESVKSTLAFLESLPEMEPARRPAINRFFEAMERPPRRVRYRNPDVEPLPTGRPRRYRPQKGICQ